MKYIKYIFGIVLLGTTIAGITLFLIYSKKDAVTPKKKTQSLLSVSTVYPSRKSIEKKLRIPGEVFPLYSAKIYAQTAGYIRAVQVDKGDWVKEGQILVEIDIPEEKAKLIEAKAKIQEIHAEFLKYKAEKKRLQIEYKEIQAKIEKAKANILKIKTSSDNNQMMVDINQKIYDRTKIALKTTPNIVSYDQLDEALAKYQLARGSVLQENANLKVAEAELSIAETSLGTIKAQEEILEAYAKATEAKKGAAIENAKIMETIIQFATIRAPFSGVITNRYVDPGDLVQDASDTNVQMPMLEIMDIQKVRVQFHVPESDVPFIEMGENGNNVSLILTSGDIVQHKIKRISWALEQDTKTMLAEMEVDNLEKKLRPGMYIRAEVVLSRRENALTIPAKALIVEKQLYYVYVVENGIVIKKAITTGYDNGQILEVQEGLNDNDMIVTAGKSSIREGTKVEVFMEK